MKRLALLSTVPLLAAVLVLGLSRGPAPAQAEIVPLAATPTPRPGSNSPAQQQPNICAMGPEYRHGGDETLALTNFAMDLPPGDYLVGTIARVQAPTVEVCHLPDASVLRLSDYGTE